MTIPLDYDEAARVDGANAFQIWWSIIPPLSRPVLATIAILVLFFAAQRYFVQGIVMSGIKG